MAYAHQSSAMAVGRMAGTSTTTLVLRETRETKRNFETQTPKENFE